MADFARMLAAANPGGLHVEAELNKNFAVHSPNVNQRVRPKGWVRVGLLLTRHLHVDAASGVVFPACAPCVGRADTVLTGSQPSAAAWRWSRAE